MYNKKSKASAILTSISGLLLLLLMLVLPVLMGTGVLEGAAALIFVVAFPILIAVYVVALVYIIIAFVFAKKMKKEQDKTKLISLNKRIAIGSIVLAPFAGFGLYFYNETLTKSPLGIFATVWTVAVVLVYAASIVAQIATIAKLKKMPDEVETPEAPVEN